MSFLHHISDQIIPPFGYVMRNRRTGMRRITISKHCDKRFSLQRCITGSSCSGSGLLWMRNQAKFVLIFLLFNNFLYIIVKYYNLSLKFIFWLLRIFHQLKFPAACRVASPLTFERRSQKWLNSHFTLWVGCHGEDQRESWGGGGPSGR